MKFTIPVLLLMCVSPALTQWETDPLASLNLITSDEDAYLYEEFNLTTTVVLNATWFDGSTQYNATFWKYANESNSFWDDFWSVSNDWNETLEDNNWYLYSYETTLYLEIGMDAPNHARISGDVNVSIGNNIIYSYSDIQESGSHHTLTLYGLNVTDWASASQQDVTITIVYPMELVEQVEDAIFTTDLTFEYDYDTFGFYEYADVDETVTLEGPVLKMDWGSDVTLDGDTQAGDTVRVWVEISHKSFSTEAADDVEIEISMGSKGGVEYASLVSNSATVTNSDTSTTDSLSDLSHTVSSLPLGETLLFEFNVTMEDNLPLDYYYDGPVSWTYSASLADVDYSDDDDITFDTKSANFSYSDSDVNFDSLLYVGSSFTISRSFQMPLGSMDVTFDYDLTTSGFDDIPLEFTKIALKLPSYMSVNGGDGDNPVYYRKKKKVPTATLP